MRNFLYMIAIASVCSIGCAAGSEVQVKPEAEPSLYGNWIYIDAQTSSGIGTTIRGDGTYSLFVLRLTSETKANVAREDGSFTVSNGKLNVMPTATTCPDMSKSGAFPYTLTSKALTVFLPSGVFAMTPNDAEAADNFVATYGCFKDGTFTKSNLVPFK